MTEIYLRHDGVKSGPLNDEDVRAAYLRTEHSPTVMSWRPGERSWVSLGKRWGRRKERNRSAIGWLLVVALVGLLTVGVVFPMVGWFLSPTLKSFKALVLLSSTLGVSAGTLLFAYCRRPRSAATSLRAVLAGAALVAIATLSVAVLRQQGAVERVRRANPDAQMTVSSDGHVLVIEGYIADEFLTRFIELLAQNPDVQRVDITSPGGLIDNALGVAQIIQSRSLAVRVPSKCASACVLIWAASPRREIALGGLIGLHQTAVDLDLPTEWRTAALDMLEPQSLVLLKRAGFSAALLVKRSATSPQEVQWIAPIEMVDEGVVLRVVDNLGLPVDSRSELVMADVLRRDGADPDAWRLYLAYASRAPTQAQAHADSIRLAQKQSGDIVKESSALGDASKLYALTYAPDDAVVQWATKMRHLIDDAVARNDAKACGSAIDGVPNVGVDKVVRHQAIGLLADLMESVSPSSPATPIDPAYAEKVTAFIRADFRALVADRGYPAEWPHWTSLQRCNLIGSLYAGALDQRPHNAAVAIRVIEGVGPK